MSAVDHDNIPEQALELLRAGTPVALATVVETWGSAPRPVGSMLAIGAGAEMIGSVSGGCVEGAVVAEALEAVVDGRCRVLDFGVSDDEAFAVGLACGGRIRVMVEPVDTGQGPSREMLETLVAARAARRRIALAVNPETWERRLIEGPGDPLWNAAEARFTADKSGFEGEWFIGIHNPPLRMVVVGAVHIAQPLLQMARLAGYDPVLVDPRDAFASDQRFPGETILRDWPDAALEQAGLDARTAVVTLTHDPKLDDPAIRIALRAPVFYLGCLGSTRTHAKRVARLEEAGFTPAEIARIHAPVGLDIGAKSPAEIALSILAQITERLRRPETRP
ncbi:XdhC family protein [Halovulum dunhuangense]|uniref:XdhC family protein n=1 Tax=Halovulum dunhuangense TaxID=1505036 RepID=A0A849L122_9RHOB|nr:XdhC family protein [Halovulum dunhuangense]NNU79963.1 XdhC family protein [Halovulum dunhuangense]